MSIDSLTWGEDYFYEHDALYRKSIRECLFDLGRSLTRPMKYNVETFSGMDGWLNMTGKLAHKRRSRE